MAASEASRHRRIIALMALVKLVLTADFAIVSIAIPSIGRDLGVGPALLSWIVTANTLVLAGTLIIGGKLVDRFGHRRALILGIVMFTAGSIGAGLAPSFPFVLAARTIQALAVALLSPAAFALITAFLPDGPVRHRALGVFGIAQGASLILGLLCGGWIVSAFGWRAVFLVNVPLLAIALVMTLRTVPRAPLVVRDPIDFGGAVTLTTALVLFVSSVVMLGKVGPNWLAFAMLGGSMIAGIGFAMIERRVAAPLVPLALFNRPMFGLSAWMLLLFLGGVGGLMVLSQIYMQRVLGFSAAAAGLGAMPYALAVIAAGQMAPTLLARLSVRTAAIGAGLCNLSGLLWLAATMGQPYAMSIAPGMVLCALGSVTTFIVLMQAATAPLAPAEQGVGSAVLFTAQQVGTGLGASITMLLLDTSGGDPTASSFRLPFLVLAVGIAIAVTSLLTLGPRRQRFRQSEGEGA